MLGRLQLSLADRNTEKIIKSTKLQTMTNTAFTNEEYREFIDSVRLGSIIECQSIAMVVTEITLEKARGFDIKEYEKTGRKHMIAFHWETLLNNHIMSRGRPKVLNG